MNEKSKNLAGIIGPTIIVMVTAEMRIWNPNLYNEQIVPLIYFSGVLLFIAGLSIIRMHNVWALNWSVLITLIGWGSLILGITRIYFPQSYKTQFKNDSSTMVVELILIFLGIILTAKAYWPVKNN
ncbi:MAG: hypothetical protein SH817_08185 [Leptospira sp.]|nr:hypothetical protein [Leptospira sp.]